MPRLTDKQLNEVAEDLFIASRTDIYDVLVEIRDELRKQNGIHR